LLAVEAYCFQVSPICILIVAVNMIDSALFS
jgi:hypothetical protein